jgi:transcription antitermination factor NusG
MDPRDSQCRSPWTWGYQPGDPVRIVDGTFVGENGEVLSWEEAKTLRQGQVHGPARPTAGIVWVRLMLFGRPAVVDLLPEQIRHRELE